MKLRRGREQQTGLQRHTVRVSLVSIRHPMYGGFVLFALGTALMLGSWYGVLGAFCLIGLVLDARSSKSGCCGKNWRGTSTT